VVKKSLILGLYQYDEYSDAELCCPYLKPSLTEKPLKENKSSVLNNEMFLYTRYQNIW